MRTIMNQYFGDASFDELNRNLFAFAAYNAGPKPDRAPPKNRR